MRIIDFADGFESAASPTQGIIEASALVKYADDAAYVTAKGSPEAGGDAYYNTTDNTVRFYNGSSWVEVIVDVSGTVTIPSDLVVSGDLTVNGTTTTINTANLDVEDKNITVNSGGNDATSEGAGLTVDRTGTSGSLVYEDALTSKFKVGALGSEVEIADVSSVQTVTNKVIDANNNTISNLFHGSEVDNPSSGVHGVIGNVVGTSDSQSLTNKTIDGDLNTITNLFHGSEVDNPSSGVHGVTGSVVGTTDTQSLSNKTFSDSITGLHISTPSTPASGRNKLYFKSDRLLYTKDDLGVESLVGGYQINGNAFNIISTSTVLTTAYDIVACDNSSGAFSVDLPVAPTVIGKIYTIYRAGTDFSNPITINASSGLYPFIPSAAISTVLRTKDESITVKATASGWYVLDRKTDFLYTSNSWVNSFGAFRFTTGFANGNSVQSLRVQRNGSLATVTAGFQLGSTTSGTGNVNFTVNSPLTIDTAQNFAPAGDIVACGTITLHQVGISRYPGIAVQTTSGHLEFFTTTTPNQIISKTSPFAFTTDDGWTSTFVIKINGWED